MREAIERRLGDLARRAGLAGLSPSVVGAAAVLLAVVVALAVWRWWPRAEVEVAPVGGTAAGAERVATESGTASAAPVADRKKGGDGEGRGGPETVTVHVVGAVLRPGVYELPASARVRDAVGAAGGLTGNAAQAAVNMARPLTDGEQIVLPTEGEYRSGPGNQASAGSAEGVAAPTGGVSAGGGPVNINTADASALDVLPGVGPSTAAKIIAEREANGPFESPDDLGRVAGIGPKRLEQLKDLISVR